MMPMRRESRTDIRTFPAPRLSLFVVQNSLASPPAADATGVDCTERKGAPGGRVGS